MVEACDREIEKQLMDKISTKNGEKWLIFHRQGGRGRKPIRTELYTICQLICIKFSGVNVTEVSGISEIIVLTILLKVVTDMSKWKNEHQFIFW